MYPPQLEHMARPLYAYQLYFVVKVQYERRSRARHSCWKCLFLQPGWSAWVHALQYDVIVFDNLDFRCITRQTYAVLKTPDGFLQNDRDKANAMPSPVDERVSSSHHREHVEANHRSVDDFSSDE